MDMEDTTLCCGCLCSGRKMILLTKHRKKQSFLKILNEIPMLSEDLPVWLCWECDAQISGFMKFKQKVNNSYNLFIESLKQNTNLSKLRSKPRLTTHALYNINLPYLQTDELSEANIYEIIKTRPHLTTHAVYNIHLPETQANITEVIKTEDLPETIPIKEECNNDFDTNSDNEKLIDISLKKKQLLNSKVKKKKKKKKEIEFYKVVELSPQELEEDRRLAMLKDDYVNAMFRCEKCIVSFPNAEDLKDHIRIKHDLNSSKLKCDICECSFATGVSYTYHANKHMRRYQCALCQDRFMSLRAVTKHYDFRHFQGTSIEIDIHNNDHHNDTITGDGNDETADDNGAKSSSVSYACELCDKSFRWKASLRKHVEAHKIEAGQKRTPYCEPCRLSFTNTSNLQKHVKTSSKHQIQLKLRKLEELPEDPTSFETRQQKVERIKCSINSAKKKFPCPQCDRKFQWRGNLLRHLNSHLARANGELVCEPCNRTFSSIATYHQHMKISRKHVSENDYKYMCSDCGKRFANKIRLKDHVDWEHLKNYVHTCSICQKVFKCHTSLYLHKQVVHNKDNAEHLCDHCGKSFPNQAKLRCHMLALHSAQSAYKCSTCGANFSWLSCLSRHNKKLHPNKNTTSS